MKGIFGDMDKETKEYLTKYSAEINNLYMKLREAVYAGASCEIEEKMWAKLPSYYVGEKFVRLIPFKDHINVEAQKIIDYKNELDGYKITPKGMLQIYVGDDIPMEVLVKVFKDTLC
ncbi:MAG: DUF1801 domain-containing protein [Roseburia sp.]|nr:DUF1801 domain-containing protein [Roseburia sp.]